jgi:predicted nucleic acid-binding protein
MLGPISGERDVDLMSGGLVNDQKITHVCAAQLIVGIQQFDAINGAIRSHVDDHFFADLDRLYVTGTPFPINDVWIAAHAIEMGSVVIMYDAHFKLVSGLRL